MSSQLIVISGPSGAGKSTLMKRLITEFPIFDVSVSHTTRNPRIGEINEVDYNFVTKDHFEEMIRVNNFVEHAQFSSNYYGTSKTAIQTILNAKKHCILDIEMQGVKNILKMDDLNPTCVFIRAPTSQILYKRLVKRDLTESDTIDKQRKTQDNIKQRMAAAKQAIEFSEEKNVYDFKVVNDNLEDAYEDFKNIMLFTCGIEGGNIENLKCSEVVQDL